MRDLAIIIRCHGNIPINFHYGCTVEDVLTDFHVSFDYRAFVKSLYIVSLAKIAGVCYGSSDIKNYIKGINRLEDKLYDEERVRNTEDLVNYLYGPHPKIEPVRNLNKEIFGISFDPKMTMMTGRTLNKTYSGDPNMKNLGFYYLKSNGMNGVEIKYIKDLLESMTNFLNADPSHIIKKSDILSSLGNLGIDRLYLIDLSCSGYENLNKNSEPLNDSAVEWLNHVMLINNLKGGIKKNKRARKTRQRLRRRPRKTRKNTNNS
jgi:hypothetical protein